MPAYKSQPAPAGRNTGKPARSSRPDRQKVKSMNHGQAALTVFSSSGTSDCGRSASLSASSIRCCNSLHPCFNRSSSSALLHFRAVISCKVGISCCSMAICFCCFSIKDGILSSAACGYRADSANPNGSRKGCTRCGQADSAPYSCQWYGKPRPCMSWLCGAVHGLSLPG